LQFFSTLVEAVVIPGAKKVLLGVLPLEGKVTLLFSKLRLLFVLHYAALIIYTASPCFF
jgi:hypothetical protein